MTNCAPFCMSTDFPDELKTAVLFEGFAYKVSAVLLFDIPGSPVPYVISTESASIYPL